MRILVANSRRTRGGGVETYLQAVLPRLAEKGHTIGFVSEQPETAGETIVEPGSCTAAWSYSADAQPGILRQIAAWAPDVIWIHGLDSAQLEEGLLAIAPAVLSAHDYKGTCATGQKYFRWPRPHVCTRRMGRACVAINYVRGCGSLRPALFFSTYRRQQQRRATLTRYRALVTHSRYMAHSYLRQGIEAAHIVTLALPLLVERAASADGAGAPASHVIMLSRLVAAKGGDVLIGAVAGASRALGRPLQLTIAGEGPQREGWEALARQERVDCAFPGWLDAAARTSLLDRAHLIALPSLWPEPFGMAGLEAGARGVPAVAFACGGIPEWLRPGVNGEMASAQPPTASGLAAAIVRVLRQPEHYASLRRQAWQAAGQFGMEEHLTRLQAVLQRAGRGPAMA